MSTSSSTSPKNTPTTSCSPTRSRSTECWCPLLPSSKSSHSSASTGWISTTSISVHRTVSTSTSSRSRPAWPCSSCRYLCTSSATLSGTPLFTSIPITGSSWWTSPRCLLLCSTWPYLIKWTMPKRQSGMRSTVSTKMPIASICPSLIQPMIWWTLPPPSRATGRSISSNLTWPSIGSSTSGRMATVGTPATSRRTRRARTKRIGCRSGSSGSSSTAIRRWRPSTRRMTWRCLRSVSRYGR